MSNYEFETKLDDIKLKSNGKIIPGRKAIIRADTGTVLGIVGNDYEKIEHKSVIETFDQVPLLERKRVHICHEGAIMFADYDIKIGGDVKKVEVRKGDIVSIGLRTFNSHNRIYGVGFEITANRLICTNGMVAPRAVSRLSMRHFQNVDIDQFAEIIKARVDGLQPAVNAWRRWPEIKPTEAQIKDYFKKVGIGKRIEEKLLTEAVTEAKNDGVWGVWNTLTRYITHELQTRGDEQNRMLAVRNKEREYLYPFYHYKWSNN